MLGADKSPPLFNGQLTTGENLTHLLEISYSILNHMVE